jgi:hypothetical protein
MPRLQTTISENGNTVDLLTGTDLLSTITSPEDGASPGDILLTQQISPSQFLNSRLLQFSRLYQRYRFRRIHFLYEPIANATQSGQLLGFADFDVDNLLSVDSTANLNIGAAHQGQAITQIWEPCLFDMGQMFTFTDLYTEQGADEASDPRLSIQGVFYILAASALGSSLPLGNVYVDYEIEFSIPFLSTAEAVSARYSSQLATGVLDAPASDVFLMQSVLNVASFGPVTATYGETPGSTVQWTNVQVGDEITVVLECLQGDLFPVSAVRSAPEMNLTGAVLIEQYALDYITTGVDTFPNLLFIARLRCAPTSGMTSVTLTNTSSVSIQSDANRFRSFWVLEPAGLSSSRRRSKRQLEFESLQKKLRDLSVLVQDLQNSSRAASPAVRTPPVSSPSLSPARTASAPIEFTSLGTLRADGTRSKVHSVCLSDSEDEDTPVRERWSGETPRQRRVGP